MLFALVIVVVAIIVIVAPPAACVRRSRAKGCGGDGAGGGEMPARCGE
jgi:hypothetical protein